MRATPWEIARDENEIGANEVTVKFAGSLEQVVPIRQLRSSVETQIHPGPDRHDDADYIRVLWTEAIANNPCSGVELFLDPWDRLKNHFPALFGYTLH
jgi:hypothetical protein